MSQIENIIERFTNEISDIAVYLKYLERNLKTILNISIENKVYQSKLEELVERYSYETSSIDDEIKNQDVLSEIKNIVFEYINILNEQISTIEQMDLDNPKYNFAKQQAGVIEYLNPIYNFTEYSYETYYNEVRKIKSYNPEKLTKEISNPATKYSLEDTKLIIDYSWKFYNNEFLLSLQDEKEYLNQLLSIYKIFDNTHTLNIYRQVFILIMTVFDATIFDLMAIFISNNFFTILEKNPDMPIFKNNIKLKEIVVDGSFDSFKNRMVEEILKGNYLRGLINILNNLKSNSMSICEEMNYKQMLEIVARRNIHIHNRGIIDENYFLQSDDNLYNLRIGNYASISSQYLTNTIELVKKTVNDFSIT